MTIEEMQNEGYRIKTKVDTKFPDRNTSQTLYLKKGRQWYISHSWQGKATDQFSVPTNIESILNKAKVIKRLGL